MQCIELLPIIIDHIVVFIGSCIGGAGSVSSSGCIHIEPRVAQKTIGRTCRDGIFAELHIRAAHGAQMLGWDGLAGGASLMDHFAERVFEIRCSYKKYKWLDVTEVRARWLDALARQIPDDCRSCWCEIPF